ncbi:hypothetical protein K503DRAFT_786165 [Rhizopogon vinicolor AM-OR11-026]|uniref:Uncharacterized protein n=1 Tax=Rhizopogon vinicolor AM-OR11-026 TaxID=1314800 RepID=A0A1B7MMT8_9AGAM|nr:hypothetical protein K503DRAFT_786165 [Rhizopogon vinicolor AM-OR11-026]
MPDPAIVKVPRLIPSEQSQPVQLGIVQDKRDCHISCGGSTTAYDVSKEQHQQDLSILHAWQSVGLESAANVPEISERDGVWDDVWSWHSETSRGAEDTTSSVHMFALQCLGSRQRRLELADDKREPVLRDGVCDSVGPDIDKGPVCSWVTVFVRFKCESIRRRPRRMMYWPLNLVWFLLRVISATLQEHQEVSCQGGEQTADWRGPYAVVRAFGHLELW